MEVHNSQSTDHCEFREIIFCKQSVWGIVKTKGLVGFCGYLSRILFTIPKLKGEKNFLTLFFLEQEAMVIKYTSFSNRVERYNSSDSLKSQHLNIILFVQGIIIHSEVLKNTRLMDLSTYDFTSPTLLASGVWSCIIFEPCFIIWKQYPSHHIQTALTGQIL